MSIDEELLARQESSEEAESSSEDRASRLNIAKREVQDLESSNANAKSLREAVILEKRKKKVLEKKKEETSKPNSMSMSTASLLKSAWNSLLPTFGLTLLWIDAHLILSTIFGKKVFCSLGEEWTMKSGAKGKGMSKILKLIEPMGLALLNLGCLLTIVAVFFLISFIFAALDNSFTFLWELGKDILNDFLELF